MKLALVGSAPSSVGLAPYDEPSWTIWGCSPGAHSSLRRVDAFFELHRFDPGDPAWYPEYLTWMRALECPLYMIEPSDAFPNAVAYPKDAILGRFGRNFFTSSLAWMLALAITEVENTPEPEIGLWGVDMAASEEYGHQKPGCLYFIEKARELGIKVTIPPQSDLGNPLPLYGLGEAHPMRIKLMARRAELEMKMNDAANRADQANRAFEQAMREKLYFAGAAEDCQYMLNTWCE